MSEPLDRKQAYAARRAEMRAKSERKNQVVRESLEPLAAGERPGVVTVAAVIAALVCLAFAVSTGIALFGDTQVAGARQPSPVALAVVAALMGWLAFGLWRAAYWATVAFQGFIVFALLAASLGLVQATAWLEAITCLVTIVLGGWLFYRLVRAMARIQAPSDSPGA